MIKPNIHFYVLLGIFVFTFGSGINDCVQGELGKGIGLMAIALLGCWSISAHLVAVQRTQQVYRYLHNQYLRTHSGDTLPQ